MVRTLRKGTTWHLRGPCYRLWTFWLLSLVSVQIFGEVARDTGGASDTVSLEGVFVFEPKGLEVHEHTRATFLPEVLRDLPRFEIEVVTNGMELIPANRRLVTTEHPQFDYIVSAGSVWAEGDEHWAGIPFTLIHRGVNCTHNGEFTFRYGDNSIAHPFVRVNQETCHFLKVDIQGSVDSFSYDPQPVANRDEIVEKYVVESNARLPVKSLEALEQEHGVSIATLKAALPPDDGLSILGVYYDGIHYSTDCRTRSGPYRYCDQMLFTSFSTAKSTYPALVLMRMAQQYGMEVYQERITEVIPETQDSRGAWADVTLDNLGDMASGNFNVAAPMADPGPGNFYSDIDEAGKLSAALSWQQSTPPGSQFVYQTADTFTLVVGLNRYLSGAKRKPTDSFDYLVEEVFRPLNLSEELFASRRTRESGIPNTGSAFGGMGMWWNRDGIVRLSKFLSIDDGRVGDRQILHPDALAETLQKKDPPQGLPMNFFGNYYNNGMWALPVHQTRPDLFQCEVWVPFMSGLSGVRVMLFPNDTIIYFFNDTQSFPIYEAVDVANQLSPFCQE